MNNENTKMEATRILVRRAQKTDRLRLGCDVQLGFFVMVVGSKAFKYDAIFLTGLVVRYITVNLVGYFRNKTDITMYFDGFANFVSHFKITYLRKL